MKVKTFSDKLNVEIEKNIRMNIEEEMKVRAGKAEKKEKPKKWSEFRSNILFTHRIQIEHLIYSSNSNWASYHLLIEFKST